MKERVMKTYAGYSMGNEDFKIPVLNALPWVQNVQERMVLVQHTQV